MANPKSKPLIRLTPPASAAPGRAPGGGAAAALGAELFGGATRAALAPGAGAGGAGRAALGGDGCGAAWAGAEGAAGAGAPPGSVGSLIVAVGLGGKLMRTVCFLTSGFGPSPGFGGTGVPLGAFGILSAIRCC